MHRTLDPKVHSVIDYAVVALLFFAPTIFNFDGAPATLCYVLAFAQFFMSLFTSYPGGAFKVIPFPLHGGIELGAGVLALISPWLFGFSDVDRARNFFLFAGIALGVTWSLTNYRAALPASYEARRRITV